MYPFSLFVFLSLLLCGCTLAIPAPAADFSLFNTSQQVRDVKIDSSRSRLLALARRDDELLGRVVWEGEMTPSSASNWVLPMLPLRKGKIYTFHVSADAIVEEIQATSFYQGSTQRISPWRRFGTLVIEQKAGVPTIVLVRFSRANVTAYADLWEGDPPGTGNSWPVIGGLLNWLGLGAKSE